MQSIVIRWVPKDRCPTIAIFHDLRIEVDLWAKIWNYKIRQKLDFQGHLNFKMSDQRVSHPRACVWIQTVNLNSDPIKYLTNFQWALLPLFLFCELENQFLNFYYAVSYGLYCALASIMVQHTFCVTQLVLHHDSGPWTPRYWLWGSQFVSCVGLSTIWQWLTIWTKMIHM